MCLARTTLGRSSSTLACCSFLGRFFCYLGFYLRLWCAFYLTMSPPLKGLVNMCA